MKKILLIIVSFIVLFPVCCGATTREERKFVAKGNKFYREGNYGSALDAYRKAVAIDMSDGVAVYNLGMAQIMQGKESKNGQTETVKDSKGDLYQEGVENLKKAAQMGVVNPKVADKANYNLGNIAYSSQNYKEAIDYYKQSLRINPNNNDARRNLRIAQKKLQKNEDNKDDKNKDKNEDKNQNKDNQDRNQNEDNQDRNQQPPKEEKINQQAAAQILQAVENKENAKRNSMKSLGDKANQNSRRRQKNW